MRRATFALALALAIAPAAATAEDAATLAARADDALEAKDYETALELMRKAYDLDPAPVLLSNIAVVLDRLGRYREAHDLFVSVLGMPLPENTRKKDEKRLAELQQKVSSPWLLVHFEDKESVRVDGKPWRLREEALVLPGEHIVEIRDDDGRRIRLERVYSVAGRRSEVPSKPSMERAFATLVMNCPTEITALSVDRVDISLPIANDARIEIEKGTYAVRLDCRDRARYEARVDATGRDVLVPPVKLEALPPVITSAPVTTEPSPWPPVILGGAGVVGVGVATGLYVSAGADADYLAEKAPPGGTAMIGYEAAMERDDRRRFKADAGTVMLSVGIAAMVGGVVWYLLE